MGWPGSDGTNREAGPQTLSQTHISNQPSWLNPRGLALAPNLTDQRRPVRRNASNAKLSGRRYAYIAIYKKARSHRHLSGLQQSKCRARGCLLLVPRGMTSLPFQPITHARRPSSYPPNSLWRLQNQASGGPAMDGRSIHAPHGVRHRSWNNRSCQLPSH